MNLKLFVLDMVIGFVVFIEGINSPPIPPDTTLIGGIVTPAKLLNIISAVINSKVEGRALQLDIAHLCPQNFTF
jgi:hypothetical protein